MLKFNARCAKGECQWKKNFKADDIDDAHEIAEDAHQEENPGCTGGQEVEPYDPEDDDTDQD